MGYGRSLYNIIWWIVVIIIIVIIIMLTVAYKSNDQPTETLSSNRHRGPGSVIKSELMRTWGLKSNRKTCRSSLFRPTVDYSHIRQSKQDSNQITEQLTSNMSNRVKNNSDILILDQNNNIQERLITPRFEDLDIGTRSERKRSNESLGERICRETLVKYYHKPFPRIRPNLLKNPKTGRNLELDCYNDELKIACEYNGEQHYKYPHKFHSSREDFIYTLSKDQFKYKRCQEEGIYLIVVPYNVPHSNIPQYIRERLP